MKKKIFPIILVIALVSTVLIISSGCNLIKNYVDPNLLKAEQNELKKTEGELNAVDMQSLEKLLAIITYLI